MSKWETKKLGELTINYDGKRKPIKESERKKGQFPYYGASGIVDYVDDYLFDGEYLLIAEDGENLRSRNTPIAFLAKNRFWVNNHAHIVTSNTLAETKFLMYALLNADINPYLTGAVMPKLTQGNLNQIELACPPIKTQKSIIHILGTLDDKIALNREINKTLEAMAQAIFKSWFVDFEPFKEGEFVKSELGVIPKGWEVGTFKQCCIRVESGGTPSRSKPEFWNGSIPWLTSGEVRDVIVLDTKEKISNEGLNSSSAKLWKAMTTVIAMYGATAGQVCLLAESMSANQACCALIPKSEFQSFVFLAARQSINELADKASGSAQQNLNKSLVENHSTILPPVSVGYKFEEITSKLIKKWIENERENKLLSTIRDTLLPKLLSGEIEV